MTEDLPPVKKAKLSRDELDKLPKEELVQRIMEQEAYIEILRARGMTTSKDSDQIAQLKQQQIEATRRENVLVMRLTTKEQELQDLLNQIQELKQAHNPNSNQLRQMLLDPAVNLMFQRMRKEMDASKEKLEQAQNDLAAWKFTPDSQTGKRLMAKCRMLLQENEELGKVISSGRMAKLEGEIALEKTLIQEMRKSQAEYDEFLVELDEDVEGMQSTVYLLQQQLKESKDKVASLQTEIQTLRSQANISASGMTATQQSWSSQVALPSQTPASPDSPAQQQQSELLCSSHIPAHTTLTTDSPASPPHVMTHSITTTSPPVRSTKHNGNHPTPMDTDVSEEQQDSGDEVLGHSQLSSSTGRHRPSNTSLDSSHAMESTDASSEGGWSPTAATKCTLVANSPTDHRTVSERADDKNGRTTDSMLHNGLLGQYDSQGETDN